MTTDTLRKKTTPLPTLKMSGVVKTDKVEFMPQPERDSKYEAIYERMESLKPGESFMVDIPKGVTPRTMHNRLNAAIHRVELTAPKGCAYIKRTTKDNRIAISCRKVK